MSKNEAGECFSVKGGNVLRRKKGRVMAAGNEQTARRPRKTIKIDTEQPEQTRRQSGRDQESFSAPRASERIAQRQTDGYDIGDLPRSGTSVVRYGGQTTSAIPRLTQPATPIPQRQSKNTVRDQSSPRAPRPGMAMSSPPVRKEGTVQRLKHMHWLFLVGLGMAIVISLWVAGSVGLSWGTQVYNNLTYGTPRTYQTDAVVGHGDSTAKPSHFIAMNWNHQAMVIEFKAGDPKQSVSYVAPIYIVGDDGLAPVTLEFRDVNSDKAVDMIVHIHLANEQIFVFLNDLKTGKFRASTNSDNLKV